MDSMGSTDSPFDRSRFKQVVSHLPSGVTIVTAQGPAGAPVGFTASAVTSLSLDPMLMLVCVGHDNETLAVIRSAGAFALHVLQAEHAERALRFAGSERENRFEGLDVSQRLTGAPILADSLAWLECRLQRCVPAGDHDIVIGEVVGGACSEGLPLLYWRGQLSGTLVEPPDS